MITYLEKVDPEAASRARERYACFDHYGGDAHDYAVAAAFDAGESCEREGVDQLVDFHWHAAEYARRDGLMAEDDFFYAEQNARTVRDAEAYYGTMFGGPVCREISGTATWSIPSRRWLVT